MVLAGQLVMKNGDVITGAVSKITGGDVYIEPSYADEFAVSLSEVASIQSDNVLEIAMKDGTELTAQFVGVSASGEQVLMVEGESLEVGLGDLEEAEEPAEWYDRVSHVDVNMTINDGNTDSQNTLLFADTRLKLGDHRHLADLTVRRDETDGESTKKQDLFRYEYNWMFNEPWYTGVTASYERDPIRDLDHRYSIAAIVGRDLIDNAHSFLTFSVGAGYSEEKIAGEAESGAVAIWRLIYEHDFLGGDLSFFHNDTITYQLYDVNNSIFKSNTGFRYDIIDDVYATVSLRYDYETDPAEGAENDDTTLVIGVGAEF
jgi:putative salt-induced outer membrane protein YdiY